MDVLASKSVSPTLLAVLRIRQQQKSKPPSLSTKEKSVLPVYDTKLYLVWNSGEWVVLFHPYYSQIHSEC